MVTPEKRIVISPIDDFDGSLLERVGIQIHHAFHRDTEVVPLLRSVDFALDPERRQYHSTAILEALDGLAPEHALKVIAITKVDLFIPILTHVYGEARLGGRACIVSTHRLKEGFSNLWDHEGYLRRILKEAVHELGHTFDLRHCPEDTCIMHYARTVQDVDRKTDQFCRYCRVLLQDAMQGIGEGNPVTCDRA